MFNQKRQKLIESREISTKIVNSIEDSTTKVLVLENTKEVNIISSLYKGEKETKHYEIVE